MSSSMKNNQKDLKKVGLVSDHAYSVISVHEIENPKYKNPKIKLLKLRNPWGHQEWSGDWSDSSHLWTPELKDML